MHQIKAKNRIGFFKWHRQTDTVFDVISSGQMDSATKVRGRCIHSFSSVLKIQAVHISKEAFTFAGSMCSLVCLALCNPK